MAKSYKRPGVYIQEKDAFPNSVVQVATAIPAFIGYTERAAFNQKSLLNKPTRITSLSEYISFFGEAPNTQFELRIAKGAYELGPEKKSNNFLLFQCLRHFFNNGGGPCYIVSVGSYQDSIQKGTLTPGSGLLGGLNALEKEQEPAIVVIPDAVNLPTAEDCYDVYNKMLLHCQATQQRVGILDIYDGFKKRSTDPKEDVIYTFRSSVQQGLQYGAAYYPWLNTSIVTEEEANLTHLTKESLIITHDIVEKEKNSKIDSLSKEQKTHFDNLTKGLEIAGKGQINKEIGIKELHKSLLTISAEYKKIMAALRTAMNLLPPAAAMAGVYARVDNTQGVFKAPANTSISHVISPAVHIEQDDQEDLNIPINGKAINALRTFLGEGVLVWGARTLDGNSQDWRYINVRRTMIMLEQSIKYALQAYVFEPNTAPTWTTVRSMINNFLIDQWKQGALAGATPEDAFQVRVGLGSNMTQNDIVEGYMRIQVMVAVTRPAEFIVLSFSQKMQEA